MVKESGHENPGEYDVDTGDAYSGIVNDLIEAIAETCPGDPWYLLLCQKIVSVRENLKQRLRMQKTQRCIAMQ